MPGSKSSRALGRGSGLDLALPINISQDQVRGTDLGKVLHRKKNHRTDSRHIDPHILIADRVNSEANMFSEL